MKESDRPERGQGAAVRWLLIGSSRWHWAEAVQGAWRTWHGPPSRQPPEAGGDGLWTLQGWAAVGMVPSDAALPADRRVGLAQVPLAEAPPHLGVDRALAGWEAWRRTGGAVLVVDAGTVLSLTRVDGEGRFRGGRLQAGLALQLRAMAQATAALPALDPVGIDAAPRHDSWPRTTEKAMICGVTKGMAAAVAAAALEARQEDGSARLVITGGDGRWLEPLVARALHRTGLGIEAMPDLCLEALAQIRPAW